MPSAGPSAQGRARSASVASASRQKGGLQDQVLRLIAGQEHLGQRDHVAARRAPGLPGRARLAALPGRSPTTGFACASVRRKVAAMRGNSLVISDTF
jgi:hypothetical protein